MNYTYDVSQLKIIFVKKITVCCKDSKIIKHFSGRDSAAVQQRLLASSPPAVLCLYNKESNTETLFCSSSPGGKFTEDSVRRADAVFL